MLKGSEALALSLWGLGVRSIYAVPGAPLGPVEDLLELRATEEACWAGGAGSLRERPRFPCPTLGPPLAAGLALGGALLAQHPTCALLSPSGLAAALLALRLPALLSEYRSPVVLIEGPYEREPGAGSQRSNESYRAPQAPVMDSRPALALCQVPVFDPGSAEEVHQLLSLSFEVSAQGGLPVVLRAGARALSDRGEVRGGLPALFPSSAAGPAFSRDEAPYLCTPATAPYLLQQRLSRLSRLTAAAAALTSRTGGGRRGVVLAGHLGPRAQQLALSGGLATLRLGLAWPLPEAVLRDFLGGLQEALVLEEGEPFLLTQLQALVHRAGLGVRVRGPEHPLPGDDAAVAAALMAFGGERSAGGAPIGYDIARARGLLSLRPQPDALGEVDEEPWGLYLARVRREPIPDTAEERRAFLATLRRALSGLSRPALVVGAAGPAFLPQDQGGKGAYLDVSLPCGAVAPVAGALAGAQRIDGDSPGEEPAGAPLAVALLDGEAEFAGEQIGLLDCARAGRDVLHVVRLRAGRPAQLDALGLEAARCRLSGAEEDEDLACALRYLSGRSGPRVLLCEED